MKKILTISLSFLAFCLMSMNSRAGDVSKFNGLLYGKQEKVKLNENNLSDIEKSNPQTPRCWQWEKMTPHDLEEAIKTNPVVYLVVSPLEWHGEALAFGCDPVIGETIAKGAWHKTGGVLIPTLYIGAETLYHDWTKKGLTDYWGMEWITKEHNPGSLYIPQSTLELVLREMLHFLEQDGFKICVIVSGHEGVEHVKVLRDIEKRATEHPMKIIYSQLVDLKIPVDLDFPGDGGHADFGEASVLGAIDSTMVDKIRFGKIRRDRATGLIDQNVGKIDYAKGKRLINFKIDHLTEFVEEAIQFK